MDDDHEENSDGEIVPKAPPKKLRIRAKPQNVQMPPKGLTYSQRMAILGAFKTFDQDGYGNIDAYELKMAMRALGMRVHDEDIFVIMDEVDVDGSGEIDIDEFMDVVRPSIGGKDMFAEVNRAVLMTLG